MCQEICKDLENLPSLPPLLIAISLPRNSPPLKSLFSRPTTDSPSSFDTRENTDSNENSPADLSERSETNKSFFRTVTPKPENNSLINNLVITRNSVDSNRNAFQPNSNSRPRSSEHIDLSTTNSFFQEDFNNDIKKLASEGTLKENRRTEIRQHLMTPGRIHPCERKPTSIDSDDELDVTIGRGYFSDSDVPKIKKPEKTEHAARVGIHDFDFLKEIGAGAYGKIYLVRKKKTKDLYAMKIIDFAVNEQSLKNFSNLKSEQSIYKALKGDFVVKALWSFNYSHFVCFVLELMPGGDISHSLEQYGCFTEAVTRFYFAELILALQSLHDLDIVHRDLKPNNVMIDNEGHIKLTDFGLSEQGITRKKDMAFGHNFDQ
jgi:tRNA A-37 threonylcarbamoyl transferase component Bud32